MKSTIFGPLVPASFLAIGLHAPLRAHARDMHPIPQKAITYRGSSEATAARPIVGAVLPGTMRRASVNGRLTRGGTIVGSTFGPAPFDALKFVAVPTELEHPQRQG
jgi:hypothetical protein